MKVGSLVECIQDFSSQAPLKEGSPIVPIVGDIYTVFGLSPISDKHIVLEECYAVSPVNGRPYAFPVSGFREIQPPMDLTELIEECQCIEL